MWIKYTGKIPYNSMELRGVPPGSKHDIKDSLAKKLIAKRPKWFKPCSKPIVVKPKDEKAGTVEVKENEMREEVKKK